MCWLLAPKGLSNLNLIKVMHFVLAGHFVLYDVNLGIFKVLQTHGC